MEHPRRLVVDPSTNFTGNQWPIPPNLYGLGIVVVPVDSHHTIGRVERKIQSIERAYKAIEEVDGSMRDGPTKFPMALHANSTIPMSGINISPVYATTGRPSVAEHLPTSSIASKGDR